MSKFTEGFIWMVLAMWHIRIISNIMKIQFLFVVFADRPILSFKIGLMHRISMRL